MNSTIEEVVSEENEILDAIVTAPNELGEDYDYEFPWVAEVGGNYHFQIEIPKASKI